MSQARTIDPADHMIAWEEGRLELDETIGLFQYLIDTKQIPTLPVEYQRMTEEFLACGFCRDRA